MKIPKDFAWSFSPHVQAINDFKKYDWFLPVEGIDQKWAEAEHTKTQKVIKTVCIALVISVFAALVVWFILDPGPAPRITP